MQDSDQVATALLRDFAAIRPSMDRAWFRAPAVRVIDCVLSLNRQYDRFVVPRLDSFEERFSSVTNLRQLRELIDSFDSPEVFVREALSYRDAPRAQVLSRVVDFLLETSTSTPGNSELERLQNWAQEARPAGYRGVGIRGFGLAGFQYLRMLFGANTTKPDVHIRRYVAAAVGRPVSDVEALSLLEEAAGKDRVAIRDVDTTIWERSARG